MSVPPSSHSLTLLPCTRYFGSYKKWKNTPPPTIKDFPGLIDKFDWCIHIIPQLCREKYSLPKSIFCYPDKICIERVFTLLNNNITKKIILVIGGEDTHLSSLMEQIDLTPLFDNFTIFYEAKDITHDSIYTMPIGLLEHYTRDCEKSILESIKNTNIKNKTKNVLAAWGAWCPELDKQTYRTEVDIFLQTCNFTERVYIPKEQWWSTLMQYKFLINPLGNGIQTAKTIEALLTFCIPICPNVPAYADLKREGFPIVLVENWNEITMNNMNVWWKELSPKLEDFRSNFLTVNGYWNYFESKISDIKQIVTPPKILCSEKYTLVTQLYCIPKKDEKYEEFKYIFKKNLANIFIERIIIFFELVNISRDQALEWTKSIPLLENSKIEILYIKKNKRRNISFNEMIEYSNLNFPGKKIILSNNDIFFDSSLGLIKKSYLLKQNEIICLTRTNCFEMVNGSGRIWKKHDKSQDSWIFVSPVKFNNKTPIYLGWVGSDNIICARFYREGYKLSNPTNFIKGWHYQKSDNTAVNQRGYYHDKGEYVSVPFTNVHEISTPVICRKENGQYIYSLQESSRRGHQAGGRNMAQVRYDPPHVLWHPRES